MLVFVYIASFVPDASERVAIDRLIREGHRVRTRNGSKWGHGSEVASCDAVVAQHPDILSAYAARGIPRYTPALNADQNPLPDLDRVGAGVQYTKRRRGGGWYDVVGPGGEVVSDKRLRSADADTLIKELA